MRIIACITDAPTERDILVHLGEPTAPPRIAPARVPRLWDATGAFPSVRATQDALRRSGRRVVALDLLSSELRNAAGFAE
jgi:hypothetical protein